MSIASEIISKLSGRLKDHIQGIDLESLSRIPLVRIAEKALPNIGQIELVSAEGFATAYDELYISMFPHQAERERSDLITDRLTKEFSNQRGGLAPYRVIGVRDHNEQAICGAQFSVLLLAGGKYAVPYLQYIYVRQQNRRQDMADLLHTLVLAVSTADATIHGGRTVPFTLFETEPVGHGNDEHSRATATQRAMIHTKAGAVALMLRRQDDGAVLSPHVQPGLEREDPPLSLVWAIRRSPALALADRTIDMEDIGLSLVAAYYQSLRDEGFPEANIRLAEEIVARRHRGCKFILMPLEDVILPHSTDVEEQV